MSSSDQQLGKLGLMGATSVGVGAIVGGGILALAGTALTATGPAAMVAFGLNGLIAMMTALSFAEMASRFPESGGTYTFSKKVLSVEAAFSVGWVVCFASIVAAVLYALGLAHFLIEMLNSLFGPFAILSGSFAQSGLAVLSTAVVGCLLALRTTGGGQWINLSKLLVFGLLLLGGAWAMIGQPLEQTRSALTPFFSAGLPGLIQAMGYTFIALQGFDLIAAVGGEVRNPERTIPRAMIISLLIALAIYLPLLLIVSTVGTQPGQSIVEAARENPEGIIAEAARNYLGGFGYWLVVVAAILAMFSALEANVYAASRITMTMARDRTLPSFLGRLSGGRSPVASVVSMAIVVSLLILVIPDVATAGAASSLIFLVTFALGHWISILVRNRSGNHPPPFRTPLFPTVPVIGGMACLSLAAFQGIAVPAAGMIAAGWLASGSILFLWLFAQRARIRDASAAAINPELVRLRGRSPLVLVPVANPNSAVPLITLAGSLVPPGIGRVVLQNVVVAPAEWDPVDDPEPIVRSQRVLQQLLTASTHLKIRAEALTTVAERPMSEIARVASLHQCQSIVMGLSKIGDDRSTRQMDRLLSVIDVDVVLMRSRENWEFGDELNILVPVAGRGGHEYLLSNVLGSLSRQRKLHVTYLKVVRPNTPASSQDRDARMLRELAEDQLTSDATILVVEREDAAEAIAEFSKDFDLILLGATRVGQRSKVLGAFTRRIAELTDCPLVVMSSRNP